MRISNHNKKYHQDIIEVSAQAYLKILPCNFLPDKQRMTGIVSEYVLKGSIITDIRTRSQEPRQIVIYQIIDF
jgi:hypothetical protein